MNSSYLSYQPNDYFWVSVKDDFDFSVCNQLLEKPKDNKKTPSFLLTGNIAANDSSCNCPTTIPVTTTSPSSTLGVLNTPTVVQNANMDDYTKQICHNYIYSNQLINLQNETSASQVNFSDNNHGYNNLLRQTFHVSVGIIAIMIAIGYS
jgi:hypothetical protein